MGVCTREGRDRESGAVSGNLERIYDLTVPLQGKRLVGESCPFGEGGVRPLGDVQVMYHLAGCSTGTPHAGGQHSASPGWLH